MKTVFESTDRAMYESAKRKLYPLVYYRKEFVLVSVLVGIFQFFIGTGALLSRVFLRSNIGSRTISFTAIVVGYLGSLIFLSIDILYLDFSSQKSLFGKLALVIEHVLFSPEFAQIFLENWQLFYRPFSALYLENLYPVIFFWMALVKFIASGIRSQNGKEMYSMHRGDSYLEPLLNRLLKRKRKSFQLKTMVWLFIEPVLVMMCGFLLMGAYHFHLLGWLLVISASCLFIQEYSVRKQFHRMIIDLVDQRFISNIVQRGYEAHSIHKVSELEWKN